MSSNSPSQLFSPSLAFPSMERDLAAALLLSSPTPKGRSSNANDRLPLRVPMPRSGSMVLPSPSPSAIPSHHPAGVVPPTRTMAILMRSVAKVHRLAIESRVIDAGFDIVAQRTEHWYSPQDDDFLAEFLAHEPAASIDATWQEWVPRLTSGSIYVLVLERSNAAKAWFDLLGSESDPRAGQDKDKDAADNSINIFQVGEHGLPIVKSGLRKTYGADAFYGSPSDDVAKAQIEICFPELSRHGHGTAQDKEVDNCMLAGAGTGSPLQQQGRRVLRDSDVSPGARPLKVSTSSSKLSSERSDSDAAKEFRARPMPSTTRRASIQPRLSKAAALRMGVELPEPPRRRASEDSPARQFEGPVGISGLPRAEVPVPASLRPPVVAPRLNKVAAARTNQDVAGSAIGTPSARERKEIDYSNTPGHKRRSIVVVVPSTAPPAVAPRQTRASMGRLSGLAAAAALSPTPSVSSVRRGDSSSTTSTSRRASSITSLSHAQGTATVASASPLDRERERERKPVDYTSMPGHRRHSLAFSIPSLAAPSVAPRLNRASLARTSGTVPVNNRPSSSLSTPKGQPDADMYANTPGHRRKSMTFHLASLQAPAIPPRLNNAAEARLAKGGVAVASPSPAKGGGGSRPGSSLGLATGGAHQDGSLPRRGARPATAGGRTGGPPPSSFKNLVK